MKSIFHDAEHRVEASAESGFHMNLYTAGFTQESAERFFALLREHGVERVVDIRLKPGEQLSGFAK
jgi:hypothetical protein